MEKLWSPWRSVYINSFKEDKKGEECLFCKAWNENIDDSKSLVVKKWNNTFAILNLYPYNNGHLMISPKRHIHSFLDLNDEEKNEIMANLQLSVRALEIIFKPHGYNIGANLGKAAGAGIDQHIHFHIVPRWNGDSNFMPVLGEVKVISEDLLSTKKKLRDAFEELK